MTDNMQTYFDWRDQRDGERIKRRLLEYYSLTEAELFALPRERVLSMLDSFIDMEAKAFIEAMEKA